MRVAHLMLVAIGCAVLHTSVAIGASASGTDVIFLAGSEVKIADASRPGELTIPLPGSVTTVSASPDGSLLAYGSLVDGPRGKLMYVFALADRQSGRARWMLSNAQVFDRPVWAPVGARFAFTTLGHLWLGGTDRRDLRLVSRSYYNNGLAWSPDGTSLAYGSNDGLVVFDVETGHRSLFARGAAVGAPVWSPDGNRLAYLVGGRLYVASLTGQTPPRLVARRVADADWSPDGGQVAYLMDDKRLLVTDLTRSPARPVARDVLEFSWSPDSRRLAFSRPTPIHESLFVVGARGGAAKRLTEPAVPNNDREPLWSPDGRRIAYTRSARGVSRIYVVDADGTNNRPILGDDLESEGCGCTLAWLGLTLRLQPPRPLVPVHPAREVSTGSSVSGLAVDGNETAALLSYGVGEFWSAWEAKLWSPLDGRQTGADVRCPGSTDNITSDWVSGPVLTGDRYAFLCSEDMGETSLFVATIEQPQAGAPLIHGGDVTVAGAGGLLIAAVDGNLIRIDEQGESTTVRHYAPGAEVLSVDQNRVLVATDAASLQVVGADGTAVSDVLSLPHDNGVVFHGSQLATLDHGTLALRDPSGQLLRQRTLPTDADLEDVSAGQVLYTLDSRLHLLRLADGRDVALQLPGQISRAEGHFDADGGLILAYNTAGQRPGVLAYLPGDRVDALLSALP